MHAKIWPKKIKNKILQMAGSSNKITTYIPLKLVHTYIIPVLWFNEHTDLRIPVHPTLVCSMS